MGNLFFSGDTHFSHQNIIKYCNRPFASIEEMNAVLVAQWNTKVRKGDLVWHLGDFAFGNQNAEHYAARLHGTIKLCIGNHDKREWMLRNWKFPVCDLATVKHGGQSIVVCHYAMRVWPQSHHGSWHLYGHSHNTLDHTPWGKSMDVGVDAAFQKLGKYEPFAFEEIKEILDKRDIAEVDHHVRENPWPKEGEWKQHE